MSSDFSPEQKRYLEGFVSGLTAARASACRRAGGRKRADRAGCDPSQGAGPRIGGGQEAVGAREVQARRAPIRRLSTLAGSGRKERGTQAGGQFPLALSRPVLCGAGAEFLHVPAAHCERHSQALAVRRRGGHCGAVWRPLRPCHHTRQSAAARDRAEECGQRRRSDSRASACARAAPAPTTSATSPARRLRVSIRRS